MICASLAPRDAREAVELLQRARADGADLAELRVDLMPPGADVAALIASRPLPVIVTVRPEWEGGGFTGPEDRRIMTLQSAAQAGAEYIDLEFKAYKDLPDQPARVIVSYHDFRGIPRDLDSLLRKMELLKPAIVKLAATPRTTAEVLELARRARGREALRCVIGMGEWGEPLRILFGRLGGAMTYATLEAGRATAAGQLTVRELRELYRAHEIDEDWKVFAVVGHPVSQSRGPAIWNHAFRRLGERAVYVRFPVDDPSQLRELIDVFGVRGLSVTVPHKQAVLDRLDDIDPAADRIGAVNTIVVGDGGRLRGHNTDAPGAAMALRAACRRKFKSETLQGRKALIFGAGGTARAILHALIEGGADAIVANRDWDRASDLAQEMGARAVPMEGVRDIVSPDLIINATSVGMEPDVDTSVVPPSLLSRDLVCLDAVYTPPRTRFLRDAAAAGAETVSGVEMFLGQAAAQFELFLGRPLPEEVLHEWRTLVTY